MRPLRPLLADLESSSLLHTAISTSKEQMCHLQYNILCYVADSHISHHIANNKVIRKLNKVKVNEDMESS